MITCPKCSATLPDWAKNCQFCQTDVTKIARPVVVQKKKYYEPAKWVWVFYYIIAVYNLLSGGLDVAYGAGLFGDEGKSVVTIAFGAFTGLIGLGLLLRLEFIRGLVVFAATMQILGGLLGLAGGVMMSMFGIWGLLMVIFGVIDVVFGALLIYVIGETDRGANI